MGHKERKTADTGLNPVTTKLEAHAGFKTTLHLKTMNDRGRRTFNYTRRNSRTRPH